MDLYTSASYDCAERITKRYSTSFFMSSRLFGAAIRHHIYAVYGMVRIADEIVDTYRYEDAGAQLQHFYEAVVEACKTGYSTNPVVHAFACTARRFGIGADLIDPFFDSMRRDLVAKEFTKEQYDTYVYGSSEVVGLMCLRVFVQGDERAYKQHMAAASALGSAYQKVNFLRDIKDDYERLGRVYFPGVAFSTFDDAQKDEVIRDIERDFAKSMPGINELPKSARVAVRTSYLYYSELLKRLKVTSAETIKSQRIRLPNARKLWLFVVAWVIK